MAADVQPRAPRAALEPYLVVSDGEAAVDFYRRAFGARELARRVAADRRRLAHCDLAVFGGRLMIADEFPEQISDTHSPRTLGGTAVTINVNLASAADVDRVVAQARAAGGNVTTPPLDAPWGERYARLIDPFGHAWSFTSPPTASRTA